MGDFSSFYSGLDPDPRVRGKQFEHVAKWFLSNDPMYKRKLRRVWLWAEWPGRWGSDAGIDLVAEDEGGRLWAIQSKAYSPQNAVTKSDVDKFLSESSRAAFSYRLLIASTDRLHHVARRTIQEQEKQVSFVGLSDLLTSEVNWPNRFDDMRPSKLRKPAKPRRHQRAAISDVVKGFAKSERGQLIMACGTGKTLTALFVNEELSAERTLVLVPSLSLLKQTMQVWTINRNTPFKALPVCSDQTVGSPEDAAVAHASELGVPVTTDPSEIASFLRRRSGPRVVFSTYQSSPQIAAAFALGRVPAFDLVIADEAHRIAGPVSSAFATVLDDAAIRARRRLYMTATPRYFTGRVLKAAIEADFEVASMDDERMFGNVFHRLSFNEAIELKELTDYQVVIVGVDNATYREWAETGTLITRDGLSVTDARTLAGQIGLAKAMRKYDLHRVISFHSRVSRAREFADEMEDVLAWMPAQQRPEGPLWSRHASGEMSAGQRHVLLQRLGKLGEGERGLLTNARCLSEGVDVPTLDGVAFIDPRRSEVDVVQAVGRAIRKAENKAVGTIVIPVFVDADIEPEAALDDSAFKPIWDVIQALRAHDAELAEQLDALRRELGRVGGHPRLPDKIHTDIPARVGIDFARAFDVRLVEQTTQSWEFWFGLLEKYVAEHGTALVRGKEHFAGYRLGQWVIVQRTKWEALSDDRRHRLSRLPGWTTNVHETQWEQWFRRLQGYVNEYGTARVRDDYVDRDGNRLGKWVGKQRTKWDMLTDDQRERLGGLSGWILDVREAQWEEGFAHLQRYAIDHGSVTVLKEAVVNGYRLGQWTAHQRMTWDSLSKEKQARLESLPGWTTNTLDYKWQRAFQYLQQFVSEKGHARVPQKYFTPDGYGLGKWVSVQRRVWAALDEERRQRLNDLPGWSLDARGAWWDEGFGYLRQYVAEHGTALLRQNIVYNGYPLGQWVSNQKTRWDSLTAERQQKLQELPGWALDARAARWEQGFSHLQEYAETHRTARLPSSKYVHNGFKLGIWVNTQRQNWSTLNEERKKRLEGLPDWTENTRNALWDEGFDYLSRYVQAKGDALVPSDCIFQDFRLGQWVTVQRSGWEGLDNIRKQQLSDLPGWAVSAREARWERTFEQLVEYARKHGDASPPQSFAGADGPRLGLWVQKQRQSKANGTLAESLSARLEELPGWRWTPNEIRWDDRFRRLQRYADENGHACPAQTYQDTDGYRLGAWVNLQRHLGRKGTLQPELRDRLQALPGWQWTPRAALWEDGLSRLHEYVEKNGHACPPQTYIAEDGYRLGAWVSQQRQKNASGALSVERRDRLSNVPGWQWTRPRGAAARRR